MGLGRLSTIWARELAGPEPSGRAGRSLEVSFYPYSCVLSSFGWFVVVLQVLLKHILAALLFYAQHLINFIVSLSVFVAIQ